jgi:hypothetical protein
MSKHGGSSRGLLMAVCAIQKSTSLWRNFVDSLAWMAVDLRANQAELQHIMPGWMAPRYTSVRSRLVSGTPTWSWYSINGAVDFQTSSMWSREYAGSQASTHVVTKSSQWVKINKVVSCPAHSEAPTGNVKGGYIVVTAPLVPIQLVILSASLGEQFITDFYADQQEGRPIALAQGATLSVARIALDANEMLCDDCGCRCKYGTPWIEGSSKDAGCWLEEHSKTLNCWLKEKCTCEKSEGKLGFDADQRYFALWLHIGTWVDRRRTLFLKE